MSRQNADPRLVTEILGVHPQLLLDDIINGANETIYESVDSLEDFLRGWIEEKEKAGADGDELRKELDQVSSINAREGKRRAFGAIEHVSTHSSMGKN